MLGQSCLHPNQRARGKGPARAQTELLGQELSWDFPEAGNIRSPMLEDFRLFSFRNKFSNLVVKCKWILLASLKPVSTSFFPHPPPPGPLIIEIGKRGSLIAVDLESKKISTWENLWDSLVKLPLQANGGLETWNLESGVLT